MALSEEQIAFLDAFAECGNISAAARKIAHDRDDRTAEAIRKAHYRDWMQCEEYASEFAARRPMAAGTLEDAGWDRAVHGWYDPVYQSGVEVGQVWRYDSGLLKFLLRGNMPEKYGDRVQHEHEGGVKVVVEYVDAARDQG